MKVEKRIELGDGHSIEFGKSTWDDNVVSIRNNYPTSSDGFNTQNSGEIPINDVKIIVEETIKNGYISESDVIEIVEACVKELKNKSFVNRNLSHSEKENLMVQAASDSLFLMDVKEVSDDFSFVDNENI